MSNDNMVSRLEESIAFLQRENASLREAVESIRKDAILNIGPELSSVDAELLTLSRSIINRIVELQAWFKGWDARLYEMQGDINRLKQKHGMDS